MNDRTVEIFRSALTVIGILLLVIFGSRAAAQARNMKLAGATYKSVFAVGTDILDVLGLNKTTVAPVSQAQPLANSLPARIQTATPVAASSTPTLTTSQNGTPNAVARTKQSSDKATSSVTGKSKQLVNSVGKHNADDFTNLWP